MVIVRSIQSPEHTILGLGHLRRPWDSLVDPFQACASYATQTEDLIQERFLQTSLGSGRKKSLLAIQRQEYYTTSSWTAECKTRPDSVVTILSSEIGADGPGIT